MEQFPMVTRSLAFSSGLETLPRVGEKPTRSSRRRFSSSLGAVQESRLESASKPRSAQRKSEPIYARGRTGVLESEGMIKLNLFNPSVAKKSLSTSGRWSQSKVLKIPIKKRGSSSSKSSKSLVKRSKSKQSLPTLPKTPVEDPNAKPMVCFFGSAVGKSAIITRFTRGEWVEVSDPTMIDTIHASIPLEDPREDEMAAPFAFDIIDTSSDVALWSQYTNYFSTSHCFVLVYSVSDVSTLRALSAYVDAIRHIRERANTELSAARPLPPFIVVGTQVDRRDAVHGNMKPVNPLEARQFTQNIRGIHLEVSAKSNLNIRRLFRIIATELKNRIHVLHTLANASGVPVEGTSSPSRKRSKKILGHQYKSNVPKWNDDADAPPSVSVFGSNEKGIREMKVTEGHVFTTHPDAVQVWLSETGLLDSTMDTIRPEHLFLPSDEDGVVYYVTENAIEGYQCSKKMVKYRYDLNLCNHQLPPDTNICKFVVGSGGIFCGTSPGLCFGWRPNGMTMEFRGLNASISALTVRNDVKRMFAGTVDGQLASWSIVSSDRSDAIITVKDCTYYRGHEGAITGVLVMNRVLYSCSSNGTIKSWDINTGECLRTWRVCKSPGDVVLNFDHFSPKRGVVHFLYRRSSILSWKLKTGEVYCRHELSKQPVSSFMDDPQPLEILSLCCDDKRVYCTTSRQTVHSWLLKKSEPDATLTNDAPNCRLTNIGVEGDMVIIGSEDGLITRWQVRPSTSISTSSSASSSPSSSPKHASLLSVK